MVGGIYDYMQILTYMYSSQICPIRYKARFLVVDQKGHFAVGAASRIVFFRLANKIYCFTGTTRFKIVFFLTSIILYSPNVGLGLGLSSKLVRNYCSLGLGEECSTLIRVSSYSNYVWNNAYQYFSPVALHHSSGRGFLGSGKFSSTMNIYCNTTSSGQVVTWGTYVLQSKILWAVQSTYIYPDLARGIC